MPDMKQIKTAIGEDDPLTGGAASIDFGEKLGLQGGRFLQFHAVV